MQHHIANKIYHVEVLPPKQNSEKLDEDLERFDMKYRMVLDAGYCVCITDNSMGHLAFQGTELIEELDLPVDSDQIMIHLNTFHSKEDFDGILTTCIDRGVQHLLVVSGDGNERLPRLEPEEIGYPEVTVVTSVELLKYIEREYPGKFNLGVAFNPYEPEQHEFEKLQRKVDAGAKYIITQPLIGRNEIVDKMKGRFKLPVVVEAWMSKKLHLLSECVGYEIDENIEYDPIAALQNLHEIYPDCGVYLALLGYKTQFPLLKDIWV
ncbi:MAG: methylenetetrahydrofolate reductase [Planctomycetes bacterium]|nr:methylenetetrahydrofolate reductase [Planctomycetota bacterium]